MVPNNPASQKTSYKPLQYEIAFYLIYKKAAIQFLMAQFFILYKSKEKQKVRFMFKSSWVKTGAFFIAVAKI
jgi:hypothetical protein